MTIGRGITTPGAAAGTGIVGDRKNAAMSKLQNTGSSSAVETLDEVTTTEHQTRL